MIETLAVSGFRSLRDVRLALSGLTIVTGANGAGKSSLYRALRLMVEIAQGRIVAALARLIASASERAQVLAVSHAQPLVEALKESDARVVRLEKQLGETVVEDAEPVDWTWPAR